MFDGNKCNNAHSIPFILLTQIPSLSLSLSLLELSLLIMDMSYVTMIHSTGATIGYGDVTPKTDMGKIAVALYAITSVQAVAILLEPGRVFLEALCRVPSKQQYDKKGKKVD